MVIDLSGCDPFPEFTYRKNLIRKYIRTYAHTYILVKPCSYCSLNLRAILILQFMTNHQLIRQSYYTRILAPINCIALCHLGYNEMELREIL